VSVQSLPATQKLPSYQLVRSKKRRSIAIKVVHGQVQVRAPQRVSDAEINRLVQAKATWIAEHVERQQQQLQGLAPRLWQSGERLRWLGQPLQLKVSQAGRKTCERYGRELFVTVTARSNPQQEPRRTVIAWYQRQALQWLDDFFAHWPAEHGLQPQSWSVGDFTSKWGHCTRQHQLRFSWRLWMAPAWIVTNVVIHELCHLQEFNHSKAFWQLVAKHSASYQEAEQWLRTYGSTLMHNHYLDYTDAD